MVDNWNETIKPGDKVYHLGDVFFGSKDEFKSLWPKLNGSKRLVIGNHDDVKFLSSGGFFKKVMLWRVFKEWGVILSHTPQHQSALTANRAGLINIHGHTHRNGSPEGPYNSVCVELTGYKPVALEEILPSKMSNN
jgi:calcineurin-like phosphoesterase family protein